MRLWGICINMLNLKIGVISMEDLYEEVLGHLKREDKEKALILCLESLEKNHITVIELYESILAPALNSIIEDFKDDEDLIWKEHVRSGIIRTIIESAYPFVLKERDKRDKINGEKVIVMCPRFEDHELGARMVSDFFVIAGYDSVFIGANTPEKTIIKAVEEIKPKYISMSVTNYYNLISTKKTIDIMKENFKYGIKFLVGGQAFASNPEVYKEVGGDLLLKSFDDILGLKEAGVKK